MGIFLKPQWERDLYVLTIDKLAEILKEEKEITVILNGEYYTLVEDDTKKAQ